MSERCRVRVAGPLAPYRDGFWGELTKRGYATSTAVTHIRVMARVSGWMAGEGLTAWGLTDRAVERFVRARARKGLVTLVSPREIGVLLGYLRGRGVVPEPAVVVVTPTPVDVLLGEYRDYLVDERGLVMGTVGYYLDVAGLLLAELPDHLGAGLECLSGEQVIEFVLRECRVRSVESSKTLVCGLRSLLRFLFAKGFTGRPLAEAVPTVARRRQRLPRGLDAQTVAALLSSCDRRTVVGRRDYAILLLLVRLGLRSCEVAALTLEDLDWRAGELQVQAGKGRRVDRLPLPDDVGQALVGYLRHGRPRDQSRAVFLRVRAPRAGLSANGIKQVVRHACGRAGVPECGAHRLRHTTASELLRAGAPLEEIAQLLRHRDVTTTAIYASVDGAALVTLAKPWPGSES
jgi:integrase/recombinase XerD